MRNKFPQTQNITWTQQNKGDRFPVLFSTRNINLEKRGYIGLSQRMSYLRKNNGLSVNIPSIGLHTTTGKYKLASGGGNMYDMSYDLTTITQDTDATTLSQYTDIQAFGGKIFYTQSANANIYFRTGTGAYSFTNAGLGTSVPHPMEVFDTINYLCVGNGSSIVTIGPSGAVGTPLLNLPSNYTIVWMKFLNNKMYVGTVTQDGTDATLFEWDGTVASADFGYKIGARSLVCGTIFEQSIVLLNSRGQLLRFGGGGFTELGTLPFYQDKLYSWAYRLSVYDHQLIGRSMTAVDEYLYINISNNILIRNNSYETIPEFPAGIYQYHRDNGITHKYSPSQSSTTVVSDYGQTYAGVPCAMRSLREDAASYPSSPTLANGVRFLAGAVLYDQTLTENVFLNSVTSGEARGDFVTSKIFTDNIKDTNQKLWIKFRNLINETDKIIVKYKGVEKPNYPLVFTPEASRAITWTSANSFTSTSTLFNDVVEGEEVYVMSGNGAGTLVHIESISLNTGTYTVVLEEEVVYVQAGDKGGVIIDNWTCAGEINYLNTDGFDEISFNIDSKWIQIKIELRGENQPLIEEMTLNSKPYENVNY